jgi:hypothetical protein
VGPIPPPIAGHSLRSGFITSAARHGASIWDQSRHRSWSWQEPRGEPTRRLNCCVTAISARDGSVVGRLQLIPHEADVVKRFVVELAPG